MNNKIFAWLVVFLTLLAVVGCSGKRAFNRGEESLLRGDYGDAIAALNEALEHDPGKHEYRIALITAKAKAAQYHLQQARGLTADENYSAAIAELELALSYDKSFEIAAQELNKTRKILALKTRLNEAASFYRERRLPQAEQVLDDILKVNPTQGDALALRDKIRSESRTLIDGFELDVASDEPITLKFKDADLKDIFNILSKLTGINFIFDGDIRSEKISVLLENGTFGQALELLLNMNKLDKKILNSKTIIIYPQTKEKSKQYKDQVIQTFYLSNIEAKKAVNLLRTMLQLRKIYVHEEINALVLRDTPEVIKLAKQIIEAADRADAEVVFELELVEINHGDELKIGPKLSPYSIGAGVAKEYTSLIVSGGLPEGGAVTGLIRNIENLDTFYTLPSALFDLAKTKTDSDVLANPKIRVRNKQKAKVHVGTKEPVITVTRSGDNFSDSIQYVDVGVKLDVEPEVQLDNTIKTKLTLEVSSVSGRQTTENGSVALTITTTNAQTALSLKDGEQTVIGGLIRDDYSVQKVSIPFLGDIPFLGELISWNSRTKNKREILLSITPHIIKSLSVPDADIASIWSGGEDQLKAGPRFGAFAEKLTSVVDEPPSVPVPAMDKETMGLSTIEDETPLPPAVESVAPELSTPQLPANGMPPHGAMAQGSMDRMPQGQALGMSPIVEVVNVPPLDIPPLPAGGRLAWKGATLTKQGDEFTVEATLSGVSQLFSAPLFVQYDPQALEFVRVEEGGFLSQGGAATIFTSSPDRVTGRIIVGAKQGAGGQGASGAGVLFRATFRGLIEGLTTLKFERINFRDTSGGRLTTESAPLDIEVR